MSPVAKKEREDNARHALGVLKDLMGVEVQEFASFYLKANKALFEKLLKEEVDGY